MVGRPGPSAIGVNLGATMPAIQGDGNRARTAHHRAAATAAGARPTRASPRRSAANTSASTSTATATPAQPATHTATAASRVSSRAAWRVTGPGSRCLFRFAMRARRTHSSSRPSSSTRAIRTGCRGGSLSLWETTAAQALNTPTSGPRWRAIKGSTGSRISAIAVSPDEGPASVSVGELLWAGQTLACATHGCALYRIDPSGV